MSDQEKPVFVSTEKGGINIRHIKRYSFEGDSVIVTYDEGFTSEINRYIHGDFAKRAKALLQEWSS